MAPTLMNCDVLVLGGGPGGYVAAIRAGQIGLDTVLIEGADLGGTCLNVGCIPSKAIIHAADEYHRLLRFGTDNALGIATSPARIDLAKTMAWKDGIVRRLNTGVAGLLKRAGVRVIQGWGTVLDGKTCQVAGADAVHVVSAKNLIIATGSRPVELPGIAFSEHVISSTEALELQEPPEKLVIIGGGYVGIEIGTAFAKLGSKVTIVEAESRILSQYDPRLTKPVREALTILGVTTLTSTQAESVTGQTLIATGTNGDEHRLEFDRLLVTVGRRPVLNDFGLETLDLEMRGEFIQVDERCETSMTRVFAIGDVTGEPMLAHRAMAQGEVVAENLSGAKQVFEPTVIPEIVFSDPEIVCVGRSASALAKKSDEFTVASIPLAANGRALTLDAEVGFIRIVARADDHSVVGVEAVGANVSELAAGFALAIEMGTRLEDIAATIHPHPTLSESFREAALQGLGAAIHA